jgi:hypothetical protein
LEALYTIYTIRQSFLTKGALIETMLGRNQQ